MMRKITYGITALALTCGLVMTTACSETATEQAMDEPTESAMNQPGDWAITRPADAEHPSPHDTVMASLNGKSFGISYGRPYKKGRVIFGGLEPWDSVWRTGADEATVLMTEGDLMIGTLHVPAGTYSLFTIPRENAPWSLVVNKTADQWGAFSYDESQDLGRTDMEVTSLDEPVEQFTISVEPINDTEATLKLTWDQTEASVGIMMH